MKASQRLTATTSSDGYWGDDVVANKAKTKILAGTTKYEFVDGDSELWVDFHNLAIAWEREIAHVSSLSKMKRVPAFKELVGLGPSIIPLAFDRMKRSSVAWFLVLEELTRASPIEPRNAALYEIKKAWLDWGRQRGYTS